MVPFVILATTPYIQQFIVAGLDHVLFLDVNKTWLNYNTCLRRLLLLKKKKKEKKKGIVYKELTLLFSIKERF